MIHSKSRLAIILSELKVFEKPDVYTEQYPVDSEIAAEVLWNAYFNKDIEGKVVADLGCGTGLLGIGALLLGARMVYLIDLDKEALEIAKENLSRFSEIKGKAVFLNISIEDFNEKADVVLQNPPFGTKKKHADREFLLKAFSMAKIVYSFHKATSKEFISKISENNNFKITHYFEFNFPIKMSQLFHKKPLHRIKVGCWRMERVGLG